MNLQELDFSEPINIEGDELRQVPNWPPYVASSSGFIFRKNNGLPLKFQIVSNRLSVTFWYKGSFKTVYVHQVIANTFIGKRP